MSAILLGLLLPCSALAWQPLGAATYDGKSAAHWAAQLTSGDARARWLAAYALGRIAPQDAGAVAALIKGVEDDDLTVCRYSIHALGRIGPAAQSAAPHLAEVIELAENDKFYRRGAARALGDVGSGDDKSRSVLAAALNDKDLVLRVDAALALLKLGPNSNAVNTLKIAMQGFDPQLGFDAQAARYHAAAGLEQLGKSAKPLSGSLLKALRSGDADMRRSAARAFGAIGHEVIAPLVRVLDDADLRPNPRTRQSIVTALGWCGEVTHRRVLSDSAAPADEVKQAERAIRDAAVPALIGLLGDANEAVRRASAVALARIGPLALPAVIAALRDDRQHVRQAAARSLDVLAVSLPKSPLDEASMNALKAVVRADLVAAIAHQDAQVRYQAVRLFSLLAYGREAAAAEAPLREALKDQDSRVRGYASRALRQLQSKGRLKSNFSD